MVLVGMAAGGIRAKRWVSGWRECRVLCKFVEASQCKHRRGEREHLNRDQRMNRNVGQAQRAGMRGEEEGVPVEEIAVPQLRDEREWALFLEAKFILARVKDARG